MKDRLQIYVIYFLIGVKMKKITLIIFTFLGINTGFAQHAPARVDSIKRVEDDSVRARPGIRVYPNPTKNKIEIETRGFEAGYVLLQLINNRGAVVRNEKRLVMGGFDLVVFMFSEKPGLYTVVLKQGVKNARATLLIR